MRRDSTYHRNVIPFGWIFFLVIYQVASSLYVYLTPLIGFFFCYLILVINEEEKTHIEQSGTKYLLIAYLVFADLNRGFYLFSGVIFFYLYYYMFAEWMKTVFKCKNCILIAFVISSYLGIYGFNNLLAYVLNESLFNLGWEYGVYIVSDCIITMIVFRDELL